MDVQTIYNIIAVIIIIIIFLWAFFSPDKTENLNFIERRKKRVISGMIFGDLLFIFFSIINLFLYIMAYYQTNGDSSKSILGKILFVVIISIVNLIFIIYLFHDISIRRTQLKNQNYDDKMVIYLFFLHLIICILLAIPFHILIMNYILEEMPLSINNG